MVKRKDVLTTNSIGANNNVGHLLRDLRPPGLLWECFTIQITEGKSPMCSVPWVLWLPGQLSKLKRDTDILEYSKGREMRNLETMIKKKRVERGLVKWWPAGPVRPSPATDTLCSVILVVKNFLNLSAFGQSMYSGPFYNLTTSHFFMPVSFTEICYPLALWPWHLENSQKE